MAEIDVLKIGFTGTRLGMSSLQSATLRLQFKMLLEQYPMIELHHGDCIGADMGAHVIARELDWKRIRIVVHPPTEPRNRAWCWGDEVRTPREYMVRNRNIVDATTRLYAAPQSDTEELRSGTWSAIRYARKLDRKILQLSRR